MYITDFQKTIEKHSKGPTYLVKGKYQVDHQVHKQNE